MLEEEMDDGLLAPGPAAETGDELAGVKAVALPRMAAEDASYGGAAPEPQTDAPAVPPAPDESARGANEAGAEPGGREDADEYGEFDWPDGYVADPKAMAKFLPLARSLGLGRDKAQQLASLYVELDQEKRRAQAEFIAENNAEWLREIHAHPEFGGANLSRTAENVAAVMRRFGTPLLTAQVRRMNVQNWPEMFFFLARVSRAVSEDCSPSGSFTDAPAKSTAQMLFPGLK